MESEASYGSSMSVTPLSATDIEKVKKLRAELQKEMEARNLLSDESEPIVGSTQTTGGAKVNHYVKSKHLIKILY